MGAQQFWIRYPKGVMGPFSSDQLRALALACRVSRNTPVSADQKDWAKAGDIRGLIFGRREEEWSVLTPTEADDEIEYRGKPLHAWFKQFRAFRESKQDEAKKALREIGPKDSNLTPALAGALRHRDREVRSFAAEGLKNIGPPAKAAIGSLVHACRENSSDYYLNGRIAKALVSVADLESPGQAPDPETLQLLPVFLQLFKSEHAPVRECAIRAIGNLRVPYVMPMIMERASNDKETCVRVALIEALGRAGNAQMAAPVLVPRMRVGEDEERVAAISALAELGVATPVVISTLLERLQSPVVDERVASISGLVKLGEATVDRLPTFVELLKDEEPSVVAAAETALGAMGPAAMPVAPLLSELVKNSLLHAGRTSVDKKYDTFERIVVERRFATIVEAGAKALARISPEATREIVDCGLDIVKTLIPNRNSKNRAEAIVKVSFLGLHEFVHLHEFVQEFGLRDAIDQWFSSAETS